MAILGEQDRVEIKKVLGEKLGGEVTIRYFRGAPGAEAQEIAGQTRELFDELSSIDGRIKVDEVTAGDAKTMGLDRGPAFVIEGKSKGKVRYLGAPVGNEFAAFMADLADVSSGSTKLSEATRKALSELAKPVHIRVFVTPT